MVLCQIPNKFGGQQQTLFPAKFGPGGRQSILSQVPTKFGGKQSVLSHAKIWWQG